MDEVIRDLVAIVLIALVCFAGAVEYVYWGFGMGKILERLDGIFKQEAFNSQLLDHMAKYAFIRKAG